MRSVCIYLTTNVINANNYFGTCMCHNLLFFLVLKPRLIASIAVIGYWIELFASTTWINLWTLCSYCNDLHWHKVLWHLLFDWQRSCFRGKHWKAMLLGAILLFRVQNTYRKICRGALKSDLILVLFICLSHALFSGLFLNLPVIFEIPWCL